MGRGARRLSRILPLLAVSFVIAVLTLSPLVGFAQQGAPQWNGNNGNYPFNWDYSAQTQVSSSNVANLQVSWIFPIPSAPHAYVGDESVIITPIIVNGIAYSITNYHLVLAEDLRDGKVIWQKELPILKFNGLNVFLPGNNLTGHYHSIWYTSKVRGTPLLWIVANNYTVFALNALNGDTNLAFTFFNPHETVPGNFGYYGTITPQITIDEDRGIAIAGNSVSEGTDSGRGFYSGFDITQTPPKLLWRTFLIPPQDGSDPNWAIKSVQNMSHAYIFDGTKAVDLKALTQSQLQSMLYADWGTFGFNGTHSYAGASTGWGGSGAVDLQTGIMYLGTAQPSPDWNATTRPGPNLWSDSILAIDDRTGKILWGFQSTAHDLWDVDCSWSLMLANATVSGQSHKVVFKACKNGIMYALDAATGHMYWFFNAPSIKRNQYSQFLDPANPADMKKPWANYPSNGPHVESMFSIESNPAYDPITNTLFVTTFNSPVTAQVVPINGKGVAYGGSGLDFAHFGFKPPLNATVWAVDGNTGQAKWSYLALHTQGFRGGITVSNGVVYVPKNDGFIDMLDAATGRLLLSKFIGGAMITQPAIAPDSNGDVKIMVPVSGGVGSLAFGFLGFPTQPGFLFALSLPAAAPVQTSTSVSVSVSVSTTTQVVAAPSTGIDPSTFYATAGVAAIFVIATGVLALMRRRPAS